MNVLVTGFEPFAGLPHNPSRALLELLPESLEGLKLVKATLPVDTQTAPQHLRRLFNQHQPVAAIHLGLAMGRAVLSLERFALNCLDFEIPDNTGQQVRDQSILPKEPLALETRLPIRDIQRSWTAQKIPSQLSNTAGLYLCNQVMFTSLAWLSEAVPSGFIHLPPDENLAAMKAQPYMPLEVQARAVGVALKITLKGLASSQLNN